jgi:hypothetical protein
MDKLYLLILPFLTIYIGFRLTLIYKTYSEIKDGQKIPKAILDFPVYQSNQEEYRTSKLKIESFLCAAVENRQFNLSLDQHDLNNLFYKGLNFDKSVPGSYFYYSIEENYILEKCIQWPSWFTLSSIYTEISHISFEDSRYPSNPSFEDSIGVPSGSYIKIEEEGRELGILTRNYPINHLSLFVCIFDFGYLRLSRYVPNIESPEYRRAMIAMRNIDSIRIQNRNLIIQS